MGCIHDFALSIEKCICMDLDGFIRVDVLQEPFELNGCRQVVVLLGDAADEEHFRVIGGHFNLGKENCYRDHLQLFSAVKVHNTDSNFLCNIFFEFFSRKRKKRAGSAVKSAKPVLKCLLRSFVSLMLMFCIHENRAIILGIKTGKPLETLAVFGLQSFRPHVLAEDEGFEPPQTESESGVLPLHKSSKLCNAVQRLLLYTNSWKSQVLFPLFFIFLCAMG